MKKNLLILMMVFTLMPGLFAAEITDFAGIWTLKDTDHSTFTVDLKADGTCTSTWGPGEVGTWKVEGDRAILSWTDGWHDILIKETTGFKKLGFAPGVAITDPPSNSSVPVKN